MGANDTPPGAADEPAIAIDYRHPPEPAPGMPVVAALVTLGDQAFPMTIQGTDRGGSLLWDVAFGDLADEGLFATFGEALRAAHARIAADAADLARSLRDGGF